MAQLRPVRWWTAQQPAQQRVAELLQVRPREQQPARELPRRQEQREQQREQGQGLS